MTQTNETPHLPKNVSATSIASALPEPSHLPKNVSATSMEPQGASSEEMQQRILAVLDARLGEVEISKKVREDLSAPSDALTVALLSPGLRSALAERQAAFLVEQSVELLVALAEGIKKRESWACKMVLDMTGLGERFRDLFVEAADDGRGEVVFSSDYERALFENVRELMLCKPTETK